MKHREDSRNLNTSKASMWYTQKTKTLEWVGTLTLFYSSYMTFSSMVNDVACGA